MKTMVISCLEPEHLVNCLRALKMWLPTDDIYVINNGNTEKRVTEIARIARNAHVNLIRPEYVEGEKSTKPFIHRITRDFAQRFPDEIILKVDEDNILISSQDNFSFEPGVFFFPLSTINNYTTRIYLEKFWPDILLKLEKCSWMWHEPDPPEFKSVLFDAIYGAEPKELIKFAESHSTREYITHENYDKKCLMTDRGISTHAVAFHAQDYINNYGVDEANQEMQLFRSLKAGRIRFVIDRSIFCHHVNYHSIRELVHKRRDLVDTFHTRIFEYYEQTKGVRVVSSKSDVCVTIGWYSDSTGGKRGKTQLAPQLFKPDYLASVLVPRIKKQLDPRIILLYVSQCEIPPDPMPEGVEVIHGYRHAKRDTAPDRASPYEIGAAHDWGATMMVGAQYAYCNDLNYVFYEQDCLVHNFDGVISCAQGKSIIYGFGEKASYKQGWAEPSLVYASREFLPEMVERLNKGMWHQWNEGFERFRNPEKQFHNTFADVAEYWPFGYGMVRPINYSDDVYFAQRFIEKDYLEFLEHSPV